MRGSCHEYHTTSIVTMDRLMSTDPIQRPDGRDPRSCFAQPAPVAICLVLLAIAPGCAAFHPVRGIPAACLADQYVGPSRNHKQTIDLSLLVRTPPDQHRVAAGDVLTIYIPRVLGKGSADLVNPGIEPPINPSHSPEDAPSIGYPIQVRDDHTIALPEVSPLNVYNMTLSDVEEAIRRVYTEQQILLPDQDMILVSLHQPRVHRVIVVRQEISNELTTNGGPGSVNLGFSKRGTARTVTLKAYENDVLHALALAEGADGLPGLDAKNTIYIIRNRKQHRPPQSVLTPVPDFVAVPPPTATEGEIVQTAYSVPSVPAFVPAVPTPFQRSMRPVAAPATPGQQPFGSYRGATATGMPTGGHAIRGRRVPAPIPVGPASPFTTARSSTVTQGVGTASRPTIEQANYDQWGTASNPYGSTNRTMSPAPQFSPSPVPVPPATPSPMSVPSPASSFAPMSPAPPPMANNFYPGVPGWETALASFDPTVENPNIIKIPVRLSPGEMPNITEEQITLYDGDIIFIESRETEVFYTGGLLGGGQYTLPRDYDLHLLEAISIAEGRNVGGGTQTLRSVGGVSALNQDVSNSASRVVIRRKLPNDQRINIEVDLNNAMRCPAEDLVIQPGDMLILQYTFPEAVAAFTQRFLLEGALIGVATTAFTGGGGGGG